jgi:hypothetical protein
VEGSHYRRRPFTNRDGVPPTVIVSFDFGRITDELLGEHWQLGKPYHVVAPGTAGPPGHQADTPLTTLPFPLPRHGTGSRLTLSVDTVGEGLLGSRPYPAIRIADGHHRGVVRRYLRVRIVTWRMCSS